MRSDGEEYGAPNATDRANLNVSYLYVNDIFETSKKEKQTKKTTDENKKKDSRY